MPGKRSPNTTAGFTLIELVVVAGLTVLIMMTVTVMFMTFLVASHKTNIEQVVKAEGENALNQMEFLVRNSRKLTTNLDGSTICNNDPDNPMTSLGLVGQDGYTAILQTTDETTPRIASYSSAIDDSYYLTSDRVTLSNLTFTCLNGAENSFYVKIDFDLKLGSGENEDTETSTQHFTSGVTLRN